MLEKIDLDALYQRLSEVIGAYGLQVVGALIVLVVGLVLARVLPRSVRKLCKRTDTIDDTLTLFFENVTKVLVVAITFLIVLQQLGVQVTGLLALFGALGLGVGLAMKDTLTDLADGIILLVLRPFSVGDFIEAGGTSGTVTEIGFFATRLQAPDGTFILVTNSQVWGSVIHNKSVNPTRRADLVVGISYDDDVDEALELIRSIVEGEPRVLTDPEPLLAVESLGDSSVNLLIRIWMKTSDWWATQLDLRKQIKQKLDEAGFELPFPQRDVHIITEGGASEGGTPALAS